MSRAHTYSQQTVDAARVLGLEIARARRERRWTINELAERAEVSRITVRAAEAGTPTVAIGTAFELATILGIDLFGASPAELPELLARGRDRLALLPARMRQPSTPSTTTSELGGASTRSQPPAGTAHSSERWFDSTGETQLRQCHPHQPAADEPRRRVMEPDDARGPVP